MAYSSDKEFIARKLDIQHKRLVRQLTQIERSGAISPSVSETLQINDLIYMSGPRPEIGNAYNCWHLTDKGRSYLPR